MDISTLKAARGKSLSLMPAIQNKKIVVSNPTNKTIFTWVHSTLSFSQGELQEADAPRVGVIDLPSSSRIIKRWLDGSVCLLQVTHPVYLSPGNAQVFEAAIKPIDNTPFQFHPAVQAMLDQGDFISNFRVQCQVNGQTLIANPVLGSMKTLRADSTTLALRMRGHFFTSALPPVEHPLSCTIYAELQSQSPIIKMTVVIGNDTLEKPVAGGIQVSNYQVFINKPFAYQNDESFQGHSALLADGQQVAFKFFISASQEPVFLDTMDALRQCEIIGLQEYEQHQESKGLMTHFDLPSKRFPVTELPNVFNQVNAENTAPLYAQPKGAVWGINVNPAATGDQPDFGTGHPMTKALQSYSLRLFNRHFVGVYKESFRPSHFWENGPNGLEYASLTNYLTLFFWSGRPHWANWNPEYPVWVARGTLNTGDFGGWSGQDNQHCSNNNLRAVYELTGDWYLADLCHAYVSVTYWNYFTKWANNVEAERCGRIMKELYALSELFYHTPEGQIGMPAVLAKAGVYDNAVTQNIGQYNIPAMAPFNACDPRINGGVWCAPHPGETIAVAWQTGFHMDWEFVRSQFPGISPDTRYLMYTDKYFAFDGTPVTYFPLPNPNDKLFGGIGLSWWSGWIALAQKYVNDASVGPGAQFIINQVKPMVEAAINEGLQGYFSHSDRWKVW